MQIENNLENIKLIDVIGTDDLKMYQSSSYFGLTTDSVILAKFIDIKYSDKKLLDIGTGLGPIPLIISKRTNATIVGVERDYSVSELAKKSVKYNNLESQINIINEDILDYYKNQATDSYDLIFSNPPYFANNGSKVSESIIKKNSRHEKTLSLEQLFIVSKKLLKNGGRLALVFRSDRFLEVIDQYEKAGFSIKSIRFIYTNKEKESKLFLIEGTKNGNSKVKILPAIYLNDIDAMYEEH